MATSLPGLLGNYWNTKHMWVVTAESALFEQAPCSEDYLLPQDLPEEARLARAVEVIRLLVERLDSAREVYADESFDVGAHFRLQDVQRNACQQTRHNDTVYLKIYADLFIPEFRDAESYWAQTFFRTYHNAYPNPQLIEKWNHYFHGQLRLLERDGKKRLITSEEEILCEEWEEKLLRVVGPEMRTRLQRAEGMIGGITQLLESDRAVLPLRFSSAESERRVQSVRRDLQISLDELLTSFDDYQDPNLLTRLATCPTLTMEAVFEVR